MHKIAHRWVHQIRETHSLGFGVFEPRLWLQDHITRKCWMA